MMRVIVTASLIVLTSYEAFGQSTAAPPAFEVASVKPNKSGSGSSSLPELRTHLSYSSPAENFLPTMLQGAPRCRTLLQDARRATGACAAGLSGRGLHHDIYRVSGSFESTRRT